MTPKKRAAKKAVAKKTPAKKAATGVDRIGRWAADAAERMLATFAQALLAVWPADALPHTHIPWGTKLTVAGLAAGACLLKCLAALRVGAPDSASLLPEDVDPPQDGPGE